MLKRACEPDSPETSFRSSCPRSMAGSFAMRRRGCSVTVSWRTMALKAEHRKYDVVVLGGGPAGATAGLMLAKAGWRVAIVERSSFPRRKVCGDFISATTLMLLDDLG